MNIWRITYTSIYRTNYPNQVLDFKILVGKQENESLRENVFDKYFVSVNILSKLKKIKFLFKNWIKYPDYPLNI